MSDFWIAVALSVVSAVCYGGGAVQQRRVAAGIPPELTRWAVLPVLLGQARWWAALALNSTGALLHVVALVYGTLIVVQPLGTLALVFALPWAAWLMARTVTGREWRGALLTMGALSVMMVVAAPTEGGHAQDQQGALVLTVGTLAGVGVAAALALRLPRVAWRSQVCAAAAGLGFGVSSALTKTLAEQVLAEGLMGLVHVAVPGIAALGVSGVLLSQAAYRGVTVGAPLATMTLANPVAAVLVGLLFMGEVYLGGGWGLVVALLSGAVAVRGVVLLTVTVDAGVRQRRIAPVAGGAG
ncbi:DMT family transporter [Lipingzhangella sp. LS1_29]|uniref:DMT family transporter n=1 Tax=Lipingzhangella rawalii TaxID=2055835 RepID=A0ABU2H143_9ACTN|nr:DMT family transporter [Lipingzhangella rawalii]MDS1269023.1 DMT family transporter [Lipingzhangella rawalii]